MFFKKNSGSVTDSKSVARCVAIIIIFIINNGTFLGLNLIKIIHQNQPDCINHFKIFAESMHVHKPPSISVADITISI